MNQFPRLSGYNKSMDQHTEIMRASIDNNFRPATELSQSGKNSLIIAEFSISPRDSANGIGSATNLNCV